MNVLLKVLFLAGAVTGDLFSAENNARLPNLFHLDDHDRCLQQKDGLYCLGVFELSPAGPSPVYEYIREYSSNPFAFNRSRLHRGYCVSTRCPFTERNTTLRFERCVDERAKKYALSARLRTLQYCTTQQEHKAKMEQPPDSAQQLFLQVVWAILVLNFVGTLYDVRTGDGQKKNSFLMVWSVRASWRRLTAVYDDGDPRLKELEVLQGLRVVVMLFTLYVHAGVFHFQYYVSNLSFLEHLTYRSDGVFLANGTSFIQGFVMISSFLTAYNLLLYSQKHELSFFMMPVLVIKRIIRTAPVHLFLVGYAATWWPHARSGALSATIAEQSALCRRKFWSHAFYLNNVVEMHDICVIPTWFLPVDMHLYVLVCALTIVMCRRRQQAVRFYGILFIISALVCGAVSYVKDWQPLISYSRPENIRGFFKEVDSFGAFYTASWSSLCACFMGLFMAHLHYELQERKYDFSKIKWFKWLHNWIIPVTIAWLVLAGMVLLYYRWPLLAAVYITIDRLVICILIFILIFGAIHIDGPQRKFFGWRGWRVPARLSLPVMICHWLINTAVSARPAVYHTSSFDVGIDYLAVVCYSYLVAVSITLLVETPMQRCFSLIV